MPEFLQGWMIRLGRGRAVLVLVAGGLTVFAVLAIARWVSRPAMVPLLPGGVALEDVGRIATHLDDDGVNYQLVMGGSQIVVAEQDLARARVALAADGLPAKGRPGFELFDRPAWGMTDFTQRINYRRALEGELERTIAQMRGVATAQVHVAMNESSSFRRGSQPEAASVVLTLENSGRPAADLVEGVASLVASSVDGLDSDRVTVMDDTGHLLSAATEAGSTQGETKRQLGLRREIEGYLERKAEDLVGQVVGPGNARVRVAADLNFDKVDRTTQTLDPDAQITTHEERTEVVPSEGQVGAASTAMSAQYETTRSVETYSGAPGTIRRLSVAVMLNEREAGDAGVAAWSAAELKRMETLVANAVGLDRNRGDVIEVTAVPFAPAPVAQPTTETGPGFIVAIPRYRREILGGIALLLAFILGLQVLRTLKASLVLPAGGAVGSLGAGGAEGALDAGREAGAVSAASPYAGMLQKSAGAPDLSARVLRAWMKES
jgi:flagellar M-ring protein FliF